MKAMLCLASMCLVLAFSSIPAYSSVDEQKKPCSNDQEAAINDALKKAKEGIPKVIAAIKSSSVSDENRFIKWFGIGTPADISSVIKVYQTTLVFSVISSHWCPNNSIPELVWDVGDLAATHPSAPGAMFFTPAFFNLSTTGADSQAGTIVHELSHLSGATLKPETYQPEPAKNLAKSRPADARRNGDNFEYYFEDLLFGIP